MNGTKPLHPTTLRGVKRLATQLKKKEGLGHTDALDRAARAAGCENFRHARRVLPHSEGTSRRVNQHVVLLTAYWRDDKTGDAGRETLATCLAHPWDQLATRRQLADSRYLASFKGQATDHLVGRMMYRTQSGAQRTIAGAARELQFMDATGLHPAKPSRGRNNPRPALPGSDHTSLWTDHNESWSLFVDEPYAPAVSAKLEERRTWAKQHGWLLAEAGWPGMYAPDADSRMFVAAKCDAEGPFTACVTTLNAMSAPIICEPWTGESAPYRPIYRSPGEVLAGKRPQAPVDPWLCRNTDKTSIYGHGPMGPRRRPNGRMPIEVHEDVGRVIKRALGETLRRRGAYNNLDSVRSRLDDWLQREYGADELGNERFFAVYYHNAPAPSTAATLKEDRRRGLMSDLARVKGVLRHHYPDCAPLRSVLRSIEGALKSLSSWGGTVEM